MTSERCPRCVTITRDGQVLLLSVLVARTNGNGLCYLECDDCGYVEAVTRRADPSPTKVTVRIDADGHTHKRYSHWKLSRFADAT